MGNLSLDKNKSLKIKEIIVNIALTGALITGAFYGLQTINSAIELQQGLNGSESQTEIVTEAINPEWEEYMNTNHDEISENNIDEEIPPRFNFESLWETNPNIVAVIESDIFADGYYPVIGTSSVDEENYYLNHTVDNTESPSGSIISDSRNGSNLEGDIIIIWGHNMHHQDGLMFANLTNYINQEYADEHPTMTLYTPDGVEQLTLYSCIIEDPINLPVGDFASEEEKMSFLNYMQNNSLVETQLNPEEDGEYVILVTCYARSNTTNKREIVVMKRDSLQKNINTERTL